MVRQKTVVMRQYDRYGWKGENMGKKEGQEKTEYPVLE